MDLRTQTSLLAAVLAIALAGAVLLRARKRRVHLLFGVFSSTVALWYASTVIQRLSPGKVSDRINLIFAVLLPLAGVGFFGAFIDENSARLRTIWRLALGGAFIIICAILSPLAQHISVRTAIFLYVVAFTGLPLWAVFERARASVSKSERKRLRFLAVFGTLAAVFTLVDYLPLVGLDIPPVGTTLTLIFLFLLSQSIVTYRILDLYELAGRLTVLTALAFGLAAVLWVLVTIAGQRFFLHAVVAALAVLVMIDPLRTWAEKKIGSVFFRERVDFERTVAGIRREMARVIQVGELPNVILGGLEASTRITHASVFFLDEDGESYSLRGEIGPAPPEHIDVATSRPLLDRLQTDELVATEALEAEIEERREAGEEREAETLQEIRSALDGLNADACLGVLSSDEEIVGLITVRDERQRDAFSPEELQLLRGVAAQTAIAIENSRLYDRLTERRRLEALGQMSAGLAHEIRNPLGAIKATAQLLAEPGGGEASPEFLDIIVDEVDRLNRVVSSFLDYARPSRGQPTSTDINDVIERTEQLVRAECSAADLILEAKLSGDLPRVRIDAEQFKQVLLNLVRNAVEAMKEGGSRLRIRSRRARRGVGSRRTDWIVVEVSDDGPGIPSDVMQHLFVPFVTSKPRGTGLGLAISQRIVTSAGGEIEARSTVGRGTAFTVWLPADLRDRADRSEPGLPEERSDTSLPDEDTALAGGQSAELSEAPAE